jgi:hypothetical protein
MLRRVPHAGIGLADHLLAEVDADQILLKQVVVEHEFGRFTEVDDPVGQDGRIDAERHVLRVARARRVIVAADSADAAADEVRVARILALHEDAVAAKNRRRAKALDDAARLEIDPSMDTEAANNPGDRVPGHLNEA